MFGLLTTSQMKEAERLALGAGGDRLSLMKAAGKAVAEEIIATYSNQNVLVLCGPGNNGGDGFVAAAQLKKKKWPVTVACAVDVADLQGDAARAAALWNGDVLCFDEVVIPDGGLVVDAVFGTGLSGPEGTGGAVRPIEGEIADILERVQQSNCTVVAIDVPSGLDANTGVCQSCTPQAELTITFFCKKLGHVLMPGADACGTVVVKDIGISDDVLGQLGPVAIGNTPENGWGDWVADKPRNSHKYDFGHVVILGGRQMTGAGCLAAQGALRVGAGLVTVVASPDSAPIYQLSCPSLIVETMAEMARFRDHIRDPRRNVVVLGPGAGFENPPALKKAVYDAVQADPQKCCVVLDADALTVFADDLRTFRSVLRANCVLTPHDGEFQRIFPELAASEVKGGGSKVARAAQAAQLSGAIVVLKGPDTIVAHPDGRVVVNETGTGWLATAGTGDVLAGLIAGLAARGATSDVFEAVCAAVWLHGRAAEQVGPGLISADLPKAVAALIKNIEI